MYIDCTNPTRAVLQKTSDFEPIYDAAKARVRQMTVSVVEVRDAIEQSVFEVYAALRLPTIRPYGYNLGCTVGYRRRPARWNDVESGWAVQPVHVSTAVRIYSDNLDRTQLECTRACRRRFA